MFLWPCCTCISACLSCCQLCPASALPVPSVSLPIKAYSGLSAKCSRLKTLDSCRKNLPVPTIPTMELLCTYHVLTLGVCHHFFINKCSQSKHVFPNSFDHIFREESKAIPNLFSGVHHGDMVGCVILSL